ncbi:MAG: hypothetical protein F4Z72_08675 [Gemmatimonadales bacterium]|nr:hypothetical protein [Candidatus Palauibacter irciniicola]MYC18295.1 hypothetical protein [Gemmatimonadales bacterium]
MPRNLDEESAATPFVDDEEWLVGESRVRAVPVGKILNVNRPFAILDKQAKATAIVRILRRLLRISDLDSGVAGDLPLYVIDEGLVVRPPPLLQRLIHRAAPES